MTDQQKRGRGRPRTRPIKETSRTGGKGPRPHIWKSGPDEMRHDIYNAFLKRKAQANFRNEGWGMVFEEFYDLWKDDWYNRGRLSHQMCMSRRDDKQPWTRDNTYIRSRYEQLLEQAQKRVAWGKQMQEQGFNGHGRPKR